MRRDHLAHAPRPQRGARRQRQSWRNACATLGDVRHFRLHDLRREIDDRAFDRSHGPCRRGRRRGLLSAGQRALNDPRGLHELLCLNQSHGRAHAVSKIHVHCLNPYADVSRRQLMRSASAALISLLACSAPSTVIDFDGRRSERRRYVRREAGEPEHLDAQLFTGGLHGLQIRPRVMPQAELERVPHDGLPDLLAMGRKLVADRRADEVGSVGVEAFLDQQIDMTEVDIAEIDGDLFGLTRFVAQSNNLSGHHLPPSIWMIYGWLMDGSQGRERSGYSNGIGVVACSISGLAVAGDLELGEIAATPTASRRPARRACPLAADRSPCPRQASRCW